MKFSRNWREFEYHSKCCVTAAVAVRLVAQRLALTYGTGKGRVVGATHSARERGEVEH